MKAVIMRIGLRKHSFLARIVLFAALAVTFGAHGVNAEEPFPVRLLFAALAVTFGAHGVNAEEPFPVRPIRLIVPFPPGGPTDVMGRLISQSLSETLGQQVYVDNRPGAGSTLAGKIAAMAEPDGYTLLLGSAATLAIGPTLYRDAEYDPKRFVPVAMVAEVPYVMVASPKAPVKSVADLIAYASAYPGKLNFGVPNGAPPTCWPLGSRTSPRLTSFW
jgi:tripartite-type tricarboxylate transporter receptor subunit TctC